MVAVLVLPLVLGLEVLGTSVCPTPADVDKRLGPLLPSTDAAASLHRVRVDRGDGGAVLIVLRDAEDASLATRRLAAAPCSDLAAAAAVVIATWEVELRGRGTLGLFLESRAPAADVPLVLSPTHQTDISLGLFGDRAAGAISAAGRLDAAFGRASGRWQAVLAAMGVTDHHVKLGPGTARWQRLGLAAGPRLVANGAAWQAGLSVEAIASYLVMTGEDLPTTHSAAAFDPGVAVSVRVGVKTGAVSPWFGAMFLAWPVEHALLVERTQATADLPRWEALLGAGLTYSVQQ